MHIVELREDTFDRALSEVARVLRSGGVVISPTDTVYGILGDATDESAISKMFALKNRPVEKAFPIFVRDIGMARGYAYISDAKAKLLERVWPGQVTAVFHHKEKLPKILTGGLDTIGIRIPNDPFLREVLKHVGVPITHTSANITNEPPGRNIAELKAYFEKSKKQPDLVIDGGELRGKPSTVIDCTGTEPIILRAGMVTKEELDEIVKTMLQ